MSMLYAADLTSCRKPAIGSTAARLQALCEGRSNTCMRMCLHLCCRPCCPSEAGNAVIQSCSNGIAGSMSGCVGTIKVTLAEALLADASR